MQVQNQCAYHVRPTGGRRTRDSLALASQWLHARFWQFVALSLYALYRYKQTVRSLLIVGLVLYVTTTVSTYLILSLLNVY
ncbi:MAG: hypothetical protein Kow00120_27040 [Anaerolineae bacterium]